MYAGGAYKVKY